MKFLSSIKSTQFFFIYYVKKIFTFYYLFITLKILLHHRVNKEQLINFFVRRRHYFDNVRRIYHNFTMHVSTPNFLPEKIHMDFKRVP